MCFREFQEEQELGTHMYRLLALLSLDALPGAPLRAENGQVRGGFGCTNGTTFSGRPGSPFQRR